MNLLEILKKNADNAKSYIDGLVSKKQDTLTFDTTPTKGSQNPVTSDGIQKAIAAKTVDLSNYPTKNGTGATGTWPISISGAATKASQDSNGKVITDTYATKTDLDAVSKKADIQADWNSTDSSSIAFIKNIPNSIKSINNSDNFRIKKFVKSDNNGYPTYKIVEELTKYHPTNRPSNCGVYGFSVVVLYDVRGGNGQCMDPTFMYASLGYEYDMLKSTSSYNFPVVLHNVESDKYYVAIRTSSSSRGVNLIGNFANPDIELGEEILAQDGNGTPPSGWELTYKPKSMLSMGQLQAGRADDALKLTYERLIKLTGDMTGDIYFDGSKDITVNTTVNESKHAADVTDATISPEKSKYNVNTTVPAAGVIDSIKSKTGSSDLTNMSQFRSFIGSVYDGEKNWYNMLSLRHRNGAADGTNFGLLMYSKLSDVSDTIHYKKQNQGWTEERTLLDSSNYNNYAPTKTGGGASGTWGISISGNANTASSVAWDDVTGKPGTYPPSAHNHDSAYPSVTGARASGTWGINISGNATTATKATQDASGNIIVDTYATKAALSTKQEKLTFDTTPTKGSTNPVTSDGIKKAIDAKTIDLSNYYTKAQVDSAISTAISAIVDGNNKSY